MSSIQILVDHRLKLLAMKALLIEKMQSKTYYSSWLDHDIKETTRLIELTLKEKIDER